MIGGQIYSFIHPFISSSFLKLSLSILCAATKNTTKSKSEGYRSMSKLGPYGEEFAMYNEVGTCLYLKLLEKKIQSNFSGFQVIRNEINGEPD